MSETKQSRIQGGPQKKYMGLAHVLRTRARGGQYAPGGQLASIAKLADEFGVAVSTVRQALSILESEGLIERRHGVGTFVREDAPVHPKMVLPLDFDWGKAQELWKSSSTKILSKRSGADCECCREDSGAKAGDYFYMRRVHSSHGTPYSVADIYIKQSVFSRAPEKFKSEIALHALEQVLTGTSLDARETVTIEGADLDTAQHLQIPLGAPVVVMQRVVRDSRGQIVYAGVPVYRADIVRLDRSFRVGNTTLVGESDDKTNKQARGNARHSGSRRV